MDPVTSSNRQKRRLEKQEDIKNLLEEIWWYHPDETFCEIFSRQDKNGIPHITNRSKEELENLKWKKDNGVISKLETFEAGIIRSLSNHITCLTETLDFLSEASNLRCNTVMHEDLEYFMRDPDSTRMLESTGDTPSNHPPGLAGS